MNTPLGLNLQASQEYPGEDFIGSALEFTKSMELWKKGFLSLKREGILDRNFESKPLLFSRVLSMRGSNTIKYLDGRSPQSLYELYLLDFLSVVGFEHQRQRDRDSKNGVHHEGIESRAILMFQSKVEGELVRVRLIAEKLRTRSVAKITGRRSPRVIAMMTSKVEKITRK